MTPHTTHRSKLTDTPWPKSHVLACLVPDQWIRAFDFVGLQSMLDTAVDEYVVGDGEVGQFFDVYENASEFSLGTASQKLFQSFVVRTQFFLILSTSSRLST